MAWKADQLRRQIECEAQSMVGGVETSLAHSEIGNRIVAPSPDDARECCDDIDAETQYLADFTDGRARAITDYGGGETGPVTAVFFIDVLDDFLAPLVLEIDIDVGRLVARGADEALEQHVDACRIDRRDAEAIAHSGIGRRPASLTQNAARPRKPHDVVNGQKIAGVIEPLDQLQLVLDQTADLVRDAASFVIPAKAGIQGSRVRTVALDPRFRGGDGTKSFPSPLPGELGEALLWRLPFGDRLFGVFVAQLVEIEPAALWNFEAALDRVLMAAKQPRHLLRQFQMTLGIGGETIAGFCDRAAFADAGQHIL